jgi:hypothetical protein
MADISKLKVNDTVYNIKDLSARDSASSALKNDEIYSSTQPASGTQNVGAFWTEIITN